MSDPFAAAVTTGLGRWRASMNEVLDQIEALAAQNKWAEMTDLMSQLTQRQAATSTQLRSLLVRKGKLRGIDE